NNLANLAAVAAARAAVQNSQASVLQARAALERAQADVKTQEANIAAARAAVADAKLNLGYTRVLSPITGVAGIRVANTGDYVGDAACPGRVFQSRAHPAWRSVREGASRRGREEGCAARSAARRAGRARRPPGRRGRGGRHG